MRAAVLTCLALSVAACAPEGGARGDAKMADAETCPIYESTNWHAWVARNGDGDGWVLEIRGRVTMPTPGYSFSWVAGPTDRALPPGQRVRLIATPPDGIVPQVLTETDVGYSLAAPFKEYRTVIVGCGDETLHEFGKVTPLE